MSFDGLFGLESSEIVILHKEKDFSNGDHYVGGWRNRMPEGEGIYTWRDASYYEGTWLDGKKHGVGKHVWIAGTTYQGESGIAGTTYQGESGIAGTTYQGESGIAGTTYQGESGIAGTTYQGESGITGTTYQVESGFAGTTYQGESGIAGTTYQGESGIAGTTYQGESGIAGTTYQGESGIAGTTYQGESGIAGTTYQGESGIAGTTYQGESGIAGTTYQGESGIAGTTYQGESGIAGTTYQGEWRDGHMHGVGTFEASNGSRYQGSWLWGKKQGLGKQIFSSGDVYEGIWKSGLPDGPGRYKWATGCEYDGEWRVGHMHGQGSFAWPNGDKYDGEWKDGKEEGLGRFSSADGCQYNGLWSQGKKNGLGLITTTSNTMLSSPQISLPFNLLSNIRRLPSTTSLLGSSFTHMRRPKAPIVRSRTALNSEAEPSGPAVCSRLSEIEASSDLRTDSCDALRQRTGPQRPPLRPPDAASLTSTGHTVTPLNPDEVDTQQLRASVSNYSVSSNDGLLQEQDNWKPSQRRSFLMSLLTGNLSNDSNTDTSHSTSKPIPSADASSASSMRSIHVGPSAPAEKSPIGLFRRGPRREASAPKGLYQRGPRREASEQLDPQRSSLSMPSSELMKVGHPASAANMVAGVLPFSSRKPSVASFLSHLQGEAGQGPQAFLVTYDSGNIMHGVPLPVSDADSILSSISNARKKPGTVRSKIDAAGFKLGKTLSQGHQSYNLMLALQFGLRFSVGRISREPHRREMLGVEFDFKIKQFFPSSGSDITQPHACEDFTWKDYAPMVFRKLRECFNIDAADYMLSLCSDASLRLLNTPGKSGAFFFLSNDNKFFIKSLKKGETTLLFSILPEYFKHVTNHPHTLLTRFYGLHRIIIGGKEYDFVVMSNLFDTKLLLHQKFDLKGSTLGRTAGKSDLDDPHEIYKDLDLKSTFRLAFGWQERLEYQLKADCSFLEACQIMDYSMLLGIHYPKREASDMSKRYSVTDPDNNGNVSVRNFIEVNGDVRFKTAFTPLSDKIKKMKSLDNQTKSDLLELVTVHLKGGTNTRTDVSGAVLPEHSAASNGIRTNADTAEVLALQLGQSRVQLGVNVEAVRYPSAAGRTSAVPGRKREGADGGEEVVLYFGIIDILQEFNPSKRLEHHLKSIVHDSQSISVTNPRTYSQRFQAFMKKVFKKDT
ncbi:hypothetical protein CEUSTIGMA_g1002.t1 [Chlamydomonas eustigma]|uniref:1-phosphatidylinositol-4-phosphate 5-kinase n=1 Tax=Chlamydomonas eustigma TaxID=1157962 RepID=A0A250WRZ1_9CHLO|nr:hypothetical protein CEUSTIGMA_g1002.t1 [Chlamydomonas eustigma]|eukprot:GAX73551.1 hypothetical protein CEUSTIGMA_g1002.t1 [Chlamydomonas eustigma]